MGVRRGPGRWAVRLLLLGVSVWAGTMLAVLWSSDRVLAMHDDGRSIEQPVDAAIVLGGGIDPDGVLGYSSRRRVAAAVRAYDAGKAERLMASGGVTPCSTASAAELMRDHAVRLGVPPEHVLVEGRATTTFENLRFAFSIAEAHGMERLALASDAFHLPRANALAVYLGWPEVELIATGDLANEDFPARARAILRESLAWWYNLGKVAAWEALGALGWSAAERSTVVR